MFDVEYSVGVYILIAAHVYLMQKVSNYNNSNLKGIIL